MEEVVSERPIALAHVSSNILHDDISDIAPTIHIIVFD
jgi:hypothetical protein